MRLTKVFHAGPGTRQLLPVALCSETPIVVPLLIMSRALPFSFLMNTYELGMKEITQIMSAVAARGTVQKMHRIISSNYISTLTPLLSFLKKNVTYSIHVRDFYLLFAAIEIKG